MSQPQSAGYAGLNLDSRELTTPATTMVRIALGVIGLVALAVGILMTVSPARTAVALTWLLGVYWIVAGLSYVAVGGLTRGMRTGARVLDVVLGVLMVVAGIIVVSSPSESAVFLGLFLGIYIGIMWVFEGVVTLLQSGDAPSRAWALVFGAVSILAGIALFSSPWWGVQVLLLWTGIALIVLGILQLVRAFQFGRGVAARPEP